MSAVAYMHFVISSTRRAALLASDSTFLLALYRRSYSCCFLCQSELPETLPLDQPELCALLGNLMENAAYATDGCGPGISGDFSQAAHLVGGHDGTLLFVILRFVDVVPHRLVEGAAFENLCD